VHTCNEQGIYLYVGIFIDVDIGADVSASAHQNSMAAILKCYSIFVFNLLFSVPNLTLNLSN